MPRSCTVCRHTQRGELEAALKAGQSYRDTAGHFSVSRSAIERHHRRHSAPPTTVPGQNDAQEAGLENKAAEVAGREAPSAVPPTPSGGRKTYRCDRYPELSIGGRLHFEHGRFETGDPVQQQLIERSARFADGFIRIVEVVVTGQANAAVEPCEQGNIRAGLQLTGTKLDGSSRTTGPGRNCAY